MDSTLPNSRTYLCRLEVSNNSRSSPDPTWKLSTLVAPGFSIVASLRDGFVQFATSSALRSLKRLPSQNT